MRKILLLIVISSLTIILLTGCKTKDEEHDLSWVLLIVSNDDLYGLINQNNEVVVPISYDKIERLGNYYLAEKDNKVELFDKSALHIFTIEDAAIPDDINTVSKHDVSVDLSEESLIPFVRNNLYGFVDMRGVIVIEPQYFAAESFVEEYGIIRAQKEDYTMGYIDINGQEVIPFDNIILYSPYEGMIRVRKRISETLPKYEYGFYNTDGELVIDIQYEDARDYKGSFSVVQIDNDLGMIDKEGTMVLEPEYYAILIYPEINRIFTRTLNAENEIYDFEMDKIDGFLDNSLYFFMSNGFSTYETQENVGVIDLNGIVQFSVEGNRISRASLDMNYYSVINDTEEGTIYSLYSLQGEEVMIYDQYIIQYNDGYVITQSETYTQNLVRLDGTVILSDLQIIYFITVIENHLLYMVQEDMMFRFIDETGRNINGQEYEETSMIRQLGLLSVCQNDKWGYIDFYGNEVIPLEYDNVESGTNVVIAD